MKWTQRDKTQFRELLRTAHIRAQYHCAQLSYAIQHAAAKKCNVLVTAS